MKILRCNYRDNFPSRRLVYEAELPKEALQKLTTLTDDTADIKAEQEVKEILSTLEGPAKEKAVDFVKSSILGKGAGLTLKSFDKHKAETENSIIDREEFAHYTAYLAEAVSCIKDGLFDKIAARFKDESAKLKAAMWIAVYSPELRGLLENPEVSLEEIQAREKMIAALKATAKAVNQLRFSRDVDYFISDLTTKTKAELNSLTIITKLEKIEHGDSYNGVWGPFGEENVSVAEFASRALHDSALVSKVFGTQPTGRVENGPEDMAQIDRLRTFLAHLEQQQDDAEYKKTFINIHDFLDAGDLVNATNLLQTLLDEIGHDFKADYIALSKAGLALGLRKLGDTGEAGKLMREQAKEDLESTEELKKHKLYEKILSAIDANAVKANEIAEKRYLEIFDQLAGTPQGAEFQSLEREAVIESLAQKINLEMSLKQSVDSYIKEHGSDNLPSTILKAYDDMTDVSDSLWNMTDENAKMTQEIAITVASMIGTAVVTGGLGTVVGVIGGLASRAAQAHRLIRFAQIGRIGAGLQWAGRGITASTAYLNATRAGKIAMLGIEAGAFTTMETFFHSYVPADLRGLEDSFIEKYGRNLAMFVGFAGMGKLTGPLLKKFGWEGAELWSKAGMKGLGLESTGDMAVMLTLHAIENGAGDIIENPEQLINLGVMAIAYRLGFKKFGEWFPKIMAKLPKPPEDGPGGAPAGSPKPLGPLPESKLQSLMADRILLQKEYSQLTPEQAAGRQGKKIEKRLSEIEAKINRSEGSMDIAYERNLIYRLELALAKVKKELAAASKALEKVKNKLKGKKPGDKNYDELIAQKDKLIEKIRDSSDAINLRQQEIAAHAKNLSGMRALYEPFAEVPAIAAERPVAEVEAELLEAKTQFNRDVAEMNALNQKKAEGNLTPEETEAFHKVRRQLRENETKLFELFDEYAALSKGQNPETLRADVKDINTHIRWTEDLLKNLPVEGKEYQYFARFRDKALKTRATIAAKLKQLESPAEPVADGKITDADTLQAEADFFALKGTEGDAIAAAKTMALEIPNQPGKVKRIARAAAVLAILPLVCSGSAEIKDTREAFMQTLPDDIAIPAQELAQEALRAGLPHQKEEVDENGDGVPDAVAGGASAEGDGPIARAAREGVRKAPEMPNTRRRDLTLQYLRGERGSLSGQVTPEGFRTIFNITEEEMGDAAKADSFADKIKAKQREWYGKESGKEIDGIFGDDSHKKAIKKDPTLIEKFKKSPEAPVADAGPMGPPPPPPAEVTKPTKAEVKDPDMPKLSDFQYDFQEIGVNPNDGKPGEVYLLHEPGKEPVMVKVKEFRGGGISGQVPKFIVAKWDHEKAFFSGSYERTFSPRSVYLSITNRKETDEIVNRHYKAAIR